MRKSLIAAIVLAGASLGSTAAQAQSVGEPTQALDLTGAAGAIFGDSLDAGNNGARFSDRFTFDVGAASYVGLNAIVGSFSRSPDAGLDITGLSLFDANDTLLGSGDALETGALDLWTLSRDGLAPGSYYLRVDGTLVSNDAASFRGAVLLAPVPEPETYGMMLGGLGILGFLARRRQAER